MALLETKHPAKTRIVIGAYLVFTFFCRGNLSWEPAFLFLMHISYILQKQSSCHSLLTERLFNLITTEDIQNLMTILAQSFGVIGAPFLRSGAPLQVFDTIYIRG